MKRQFSGLDVLSWARVSQHLLPSSHDPFLFLWISLILSESAFSSYNDTLLIHSPFYQHTQCRFTLFLFSSRIYAQCSGSHGARLIHISEFIWKKSSIPVIQGRFSAKYRDNFSYTRLREEHSREKWKVTAKIPCNSEDWYFRASDTVPEKCSS